MRRSDRDLPYLFHTSPQGMEAGKPCSATVFHTFHTFHTGFTCAHVGGRVRTRVHVRTHPRTGLQKGMEGVEGMEEGHRTMVFRFHTSSTPRRGMEPKGENA